MGADGRLWDPREIEELRAGGMGCNFEHDVAQLWIVRA
jgi:hypothetical protein